MNNIIEEYGGATFIYNTLAVSSIAYSFESADSSNTVIICWCF